MLVPLHLLNFYQMIFLLIISYFRLSSFVLYPFYLYLSHSYHSFLLWVSQSCLYAVADKRKYVRFEICLQAYWSDGSWIQEGFLGSYKEVMWYDGNMWTKRETKLLPGSVISLSLIQQLRSSQVTVIPLRFCIVSFLISLQQGFLLLLKNMVENLVWMVHSCRRSHRKW